VTRAIGVLLLAPVGAFLLDAIAGAGDFAFPGRAWLNTFVAAGVATAIACGFGIPTGALLAQTRRRWLLAITAVPLAFPPAVLAATWMGLRLPIPGAAGCGVVLGCATWPAMALTVAASISGIPRAEIEAAELHLSRARTIRRVVWPHARFGIAAGALLVFALATAEFTVPSTFAVPTISYVIYERLAAFEFASAAWAALPLLAIAGAAAACLRRVPSLSSQAITGAWLRGPARWATGGVAAAAWVLTVALPAGVLAWGVGSGSRWMRALSIHAGALGWTAVFALVTAAALVLWSAAGRGRSRLEPLWLVTLLLPGAVVALGTLRLADRTGLQSVVGGTAALLVFALACRFAAIAWLFLREAASPSSMEAAELARLSRWVTWRRIVLPALLPRAAAAGAIVFALTVGEIGPAVLLSPPGRQTVTQHLFNLMHYGYDDAVAALALSILGGTAILVWMATFVGRPNLAPVGR